MNDSHLRHLAKSLDKTVLSEIVGWLHRNNLNHTTGLNTYRIKHSLQYVYPLFILLHSIVCVCGTVGNIGVLITLLKRRLIVSPTYFFLANIAFSDAFKAAVVLPITLANLLSENWIYGSFLCFVLPMMHSFPIHVNILTYFLIGIDRYRFILYPMKTRIPAGLLTIAVWVVSVCLVLPYAAYISYLDLGAVLKDPRLFGVRLCRISHEQNKEHFTRAMFITLYCIPLTVTAFLFIRSSAEIKSCEEQLHLRSSSDHGQLCSEMSYYSRVTWSTEVAGGHKVLEGRRPEPEGAADPAPTRSCASHGQASSVDYDDVVEEIDICKEKRAQTYIITMVTLFAICWLPIKILFMVTHFVYETDSNTSHFDVTYLIFTLVGFLSTCTNPILFASWRMSDETRDRLRGYFRFMRRKQEFRSNESAAMFTETRANRNVRPKNMPLGRPDTFDSSLSPESPKLSLKDLRFNDKTAQRPDTGAEHQTVYAPAATPPDGGLSN